MTGLLSSDVAAGGHELRDHVDVPALSARIIGCWLA